MIRVPFGALTLGSNTPKLAETGTNPQSRPQPRPCYWITGSITSVSAGGLSIPYGTTTDTIEWYFAPITTSKLDGRRSRCWR